MRSSDRLVRWFGVATLSAAALAFSPAAASAAQVHGFSTSFGEPGTGAGQLELVFPERSAEGGKPVSAGSGIAVNDETHDVYVADTGNHRISVFDPSKPEGERFLLAFGADVGGAGIDVCTTICGPGTAGHEPGQLENPTFIAVDNNPSSLSHGDVYVADTAGTENRISKFDTAGNLIGSWGVAGQLDGSTATEGPFRAIQGIATDTAGDLWARGGAGAARVFEFDQSGTPLPGWTTPLGSQPTGIALDGAGRIYLLEGCPAGPIHRLTAAGADEGAVIGGCVETGTFFTSIASNQRTHDLFADREGLKISSIPPSCLPNSRGPGNCAPAEVFGESEPGQLHKAAGLGVDSAGGTVYAAETEKDEIFAFAATIEANPGAATNVAATTATLNGTVDPIAGPVVRCKFQYGTTNSYGTEGPCLNSSNEEVGTAGHPIATTTALHADVTGLAGGTKYHFRLRVSNAKPEYLSSEDEELITKELASVESTTASEITGNSATLNASIDPNGVATTKYRFEWGPCSSASSCATSPFPEAGPEGSLSGTTAEPVSEPITGLDPATTYHFRVFVSDANGTVTGPEAVFAFLPQLQIEHGCGNEALRTENASTQLPDCRSYELVTPMAKNASLIGALFANNIPPQIALDGSRVIAPAIQCFAHSGSCVGTRQSEGEPFGFERTAAGWTTEAMALPAATFHTSSDWGFNADGNLALFSAPSPPDGQDDFYARSSGGALRNLGALSGVSPTMVAQITGESIVTTADYSHVAWPSNRVLWSFDSTQTGLSLYAYPGPEGSGTEPQLVAVTGGPGSHDLIGRCGSEIAGFETRAQSFGTLSSDGRTTYFGVEPCTRGGSGSNASHPVPVRELYARIDGEGPDARTVAISEPRAPQEPQENPACTTTACKANTDPANPQNFRDAEFQGASEDGRLAYFLSPQQLTDMATQDPSPGDTAFAGGCTRTTGADGCNLYLYEDPRHQSPGATHLIDLSAGDTSGIGPEVQGMFALSTDGTHAYFVAKGVLTEEPNAQGRVAVEGANNLYLYQRDGAHPLGRLVYITTLGDSAAEVRSWSKGIEFASASPDGRYLVFESRVGLTPDAPAVEGAAQIYRYDALTGSLRRISFGLGGFNGDGNRGGAGATIVPLSSTTTFRSGPARSNPTMSDDGSVVFFQSPVALVPGALDEVELGEGSFAQNIYEWEEDGQGGCAEPRGCISLISDGRDTAKTGHNVPSVTELLGTDATGQDVFFATASELNWADTDTQRDYYDARVGGGFPKPPESQVCSGDACKGEGTAAGEQAAPATPNVNGPGNVKAPAKCRKGQVRKGGKCVKRPKAGRHKKGRRHRQGHKKRGGAGKGRSDRSQGRSK